MTSESNNPPDQTQPAPTGKAIRAARILITLGLFVGVLVFGVFAFTELASQRQAVALPNEFGASKPAQQPSPPQGQSMSDKFRSIAQRDPSKFIPIRRDNPHPGEIEPFLGAASYQKPPYRQPTTANEVWELCEYRTLDSDPEAAFAYYHKQAAKRGLELRTHSPTSDNVPGGIKASWSDGSHRLELTAWPLKSPPVQPPLKPKTPLRWVVKYSYPEGSTPSGTGR